MIYIPNNAHDPALNLAQEEFLLCNANLKEDVLFFYINRPSVIIGKHQNTEEEIDRDYVKAHSIPVVRRLSGGGAVYHDFGDLNFSFIHPNDRDAATADFSEFTAPIVNALNELGVPVTLGGRNDLLLDGMKVSGCAYYHNLHGSVCHGTLLFDTDLDALGKALLPKPGKSENKGVPSVPSHVCNLKPYLKGIETAEALRDAILKIIGGLVSLDVKELKAEDLALCEDIANLRYRREDWNYGKSPAYNFRKTVKQPSGTIDFRADIRDGKVHSARFFGDFFCVGNIRFLEMGLEDADWTKEAVEAALIEYSWSKYFPEYFLDDFLKVLFD